MFADFGNIWGEWGHLNTQTLLVCCHLLPNSVSASTSPPPSTPLHHLSRVSPWGCLACSKNDSGCCCCLPCSDCLIVSLHPQLRWGACLPLLPGQIPPWTKHSPMSRVSKQFSDGGHPEVPGCHICWGLEQKVVKGPLPNLCCRFSTVSWNSFAWSSLCLATGSHMVPIKMFFQMSTCIPFL